MKMRPMSGFANTTGMSQARKPIRKPALRKMPLGEKIWVAVLAATGAFFLLFNLAAGISPLVTGRCLRCLVTGNMRCDVLSHPVHSHKQ